MAETAAAGEPFVLLVRVAGGNGKAVQGRFEIPQTKAKLTAQEQKRLQPLVTELQAKCFSAQFWGNVDAGGFDRTAAQLSVMMHEATRFHVPRLELSSETLSQLTTVERRVSFSVKQAQLLELPEDLTGLMQLELRELIVYSTLLRQLPEWIARLFGLETLRLSGKSFQHDYFGSNSKLQSLPASIGDLKGLKTMVLSKFSTLEALPETLPPALIWLEISECKLLSTLPASLGNMSSLQTLSIEFCERLRELPARLNLVALQRLVLKHLDSLVQLPQNNWNALSNLTEMSVSCCRELESLPQGTGELTALTRLYLVCLPKLKPLPESMAQLKKLEDCTIISLPLLTGPPEWLKDRNSLKSVSLSQFAEVKELHTPTGLQSLTLGGCPMLKALPGMGELLAMHTLTLDGLAAFEKLPEALGRMTALQNLTLSACPKIHDLPASLVHLTKLQQLILVKCGFKKMPSMLERLTTLRTLKLIVSDYAHAQCVAFKTLASSLPCLQLLTSLCLGRPRGDEPSFLDEDVLAIGINVYILYVFKYICVYVYMYICIYVYSYINVFVCICTYVHMYICTSVCMYVCMYV